MKRLAGFLILSLFALALLTPRLAAQEFVEPGGRTGPAFDSVFQSPLGGLVWLGGTAADRGLGYEGSYFTAGGKQPIGNDFLAGEWFLEGQAHVSEQRGRFFGNLGLERVFHIKSAKSDVGMNVFMDYDADEYEEFGHTYWQVGVGGFLKAPSFDFYVNGYLPQGEQDHLANTTPFVGNSIVVPATDSALQGFDARWRVPIPRLQPIRAYVEAGGYYYKSDLVDGFGGITTSVGANPIDGVAVNLQVNNDEEFNTSGYLQLILMTGGHGAPTSTPRGLEKSVRNDHVVRVNRPSFTAINPLTGQPWRVIHIDSDVALDTAAGTGTFEDPYSLLAQADVNQNAATNAQAGDILFVHQGVNDFVNHDTGITLLDNQWLLGEGTTQSIPLANYGMYTLPTVVDNTRPNISNENNNTAATVQLANGNVVRGLDVTSNSTEAAIRGDAIVTALIENNVIFGSQGNAILIDGLTGSLSIRDNTIDSQAINPLLQTFDAVFIDNVTNAFVEIDNNVIGSANSTTAVTDFIGGDGIHIEDVLLSQIVVSDNRIFSGDLQVGEQIFGDAIELSRSTDSSLTVLNNQISNVAGNGVNMNFSERLNALVRSNEIVLNGLFGVEWNQSTGQLVVDSVAGASAFPAPGGAYGGYPVQNISQNLLGGVNIVLAGASNADTLAFYAYDNIFAENNATVSSRAISMTIAGDPLTTEGPTVFFDIRDNTFVDNDFALLAFQDTGAKMSGNFSGNFVQDQALGVGFFVNSNLSAGVSTLDVNIHGNVMDNMGFSDAGDSIYVASIPVIAEDDRFNDGTGGIYGSVTGTSIANFDIRDNIITGAHDEFVDDVFGDAGMQFFFNVDQFTTPDSPYEPPVSTITMVDNELYDSFNHARAFNLYGDSQVQITSLRNFSGKTVDDDGVPILDDGEDIGFEVQTHDRAVVGIYMDGDVISDHQLNGIFLNSHDQSRMFTNIRNTRLLNNAIADEEDPPLDLFWNTGVEIFAQDQSIQTLDFSDNFIDSTVDGDDETRLSMQIHNEAGSQGQIYANVNRNTFLSQLVDDDGVITTPEPFDFYMYQQGQVGIVPNGGTLALSLNGNTASSGFLIENRNDPINVPRFYFQGFGNSNFDPLTSFAPPTIPGQPSSITLGANPIDISPYLDFIRKP